MQDSILADAPLLTYLKNIVFGQIIEKEPKLRCLSIHPKLS